ncbi:MAG: putative lipid II flippase FtsW [Lachnospiraceae bacterium]|nr:putative lipid II flippase FtsW [Lachnospiraceae bacterium]
MQQNAKNQHTSKRKREGLFKNFFVKGEYFDYVLLFVVLLLVGFGLVMVYSTSSYKAYLDFGDSGYYFKRQLLFSLVGLVAMVVVSKINYQKWKRFSGLIYLIMLVLQIAVLFLGLDSHGAKRWIQIGPISFQPSEFAKIGMILFMAHLISNKANIIKKFMELIKIYVVGLIIIGLIAIENLSTAIVIMAIIIVMTFITSPKYKQFFILGILAILLVAVFIASAGYRGERIDAWLDPENHEKGYQTMQSLYAIGSGGIFGKGLGQSMQKLGFIPESHNDMIFSVVCEELGLFGAICVITLFIILIWRCVIVADNARDLYGSLIVIGVMTHIAVQVIINLAVVTNTMPNTGVPLPFISYGGSSMLFILIEMGVVLSVSRQIKLK